MAAGESETHRRLKEQVFLWAYDRGFRCCAMEVRAPRSSYRVDVAGFRFGPQTEGVNSCCFRMQSEPRRSFPG